MDEMSVFIFSLLGGLFLAALFVNIYFRIKIYKQYKKLVKKKVQFSAKHVLNKSKREKELYPRYEEHRNLIEKFCKSIRFSLKIGIAIILVILAIGGILRYT